MVRRTHFTPAFFNVAKRVSIKRSSVETAPDICLFYDETEFEDVVKRFSPFDNKWLSRRCIFNALVFLQGIWIFIKHGNIQHITKDDLVKTLDDDSAVFSTLVSYPVARSFPWQKWLTPSTARRFKRRIGISHFMIMMKG
jgi:hypothetical protein